MKMGCLTEHIVSGESLKEVVSPMTTDSVILMEFCLCRCFCDSVVMISDTLVHC